MSGDRPETAAARLAAQDFMRAFDADARHAIATWIVEHVGEGETRQAVLPVYSMLCAANVEASRLRAALSFIAGPSDSGPLIHVYRDAGGGYEGLQAVARVAITPAS